MYRLLPYESMVWHDKQNAVVVERSISLEMPIAPHSAGRRKNAMKARIFPDGVLTSPGRTTITETSAALTSTRMAMSVVAGIRALGLESANLTAGALLLPAPICLRGSGRRPPMP